MLGLLEVDASDSLRGRVPGDGHRDLVVSVYVRRSILPEK
jgi:hypothetical protein